MPRGCVPPNQARPAPLRRRSAWTRSKPEWASWPSRWPTCSASLGQKAQEEERALPALRGRRGPEERQASPACKVRQARKVRGATSAQSVLLDRRVRRVILDRKDQPDPRARRGMSAPEGPPDRRATRAILAHKRHPDPLLRPETTLRRADLTFSPSQFLVSVAVAS
jgi:hypothetical protein